MNHILGEPQEVTQGVAVANVKVKFMHALFHLTCDAFQSERERLERSQINNEV